MKENKQKFLKAVVAIAVVIALLLPGAVANRGTTSGDRNITWDVMLDFSEPGGSATDVTFGEAPDACDGPTGSGGHGNDAYDVGLGPTPPSPPYIQAWFDDGLTGIFSKLWYDYRQYPDTYKVWNLSVQWVIGDSSSTDLTISWNTVDIDDSEYNSVVLYDVAGTTTVANMLIDTDYTFTAEVYYYPPGQFHKDFQIICSLNEPPVFSDENPPDGSINVNVSSSQLTVTINDPEGDSFNWSIETIPDVGSDSGTGDYNGTKVCTISNLNYDTTYTWYVNATDSESGTHKEVYTFTTEHQPNRPPYTPSHPIPINHTTGVEIDDDLSWICGDPDLTDIVTYDVYFGTTPIQVAWNQSETTYDPGIMSYNTQYYWKIVAWDNHGASTSGPIWDFTTELEPEADLDCDGSLSWADVEPDSTVTGSFTVSNVGDDDSLLDWEIDSYPDWGTWTFTPSSGSDLTPKDSPITVQVSVVVPDDPETEFTGEVKIVNSDDHDDFCIIDVSLATPVSQHSFVLQFIERLLQRFPMLERLLSFQIFNKLLDTH